VQPRRRVDREGSVSKLAYVVTYRGVVALRRRSRFIVVVGGVGVVGGGRDEERMEVA